MATPATVMGLKVGISKVQFSHLSGEWLFKSDDESTCPLFQRLSDGATHYQNLTDINKIIPEDVPAPALPVPRMSAPGHIGTPPPVVAMSLQEVTDAQESVVAVVPQMTVWQTRALECFQTMHDEAVKYRAGQVSRITYSHGICDNITRFTDYDDEMSYVKDNLIRRTASYSGEHHYPVKSHDASRSAEWAWDYTSDKWGGEYGANRLVQLEQMIHLIKNEWDDDLACRMTPARSAGISVGDQVWNKTTRAVWTFVRDDGSNDPYFKTDEGRETSCHLRHIQKLSDIITGKSFAELMAESETLAQRRATLKVQKADIEAQLASMDESFARMDIELAITYKVKRIE